MSGLSLCMCAKRGRLHTESQGTSVILNELWRSAQQKMVAIQIKLQEWKWTGHAAREDSSATEKQAVNWNLQGQCRREDLERAVGK